MAILSARDRVRFGSVRQEGDHATIFKAIRRSLDTPVRTRSMWLPIGYPEGVGRAKALMRARQNTGGPRSARDPQTFDPYGSIKNSKSAHRGRGGATIEPKSARQWRPGRRPRTEA